MAELTIFPSGKQPPQSVRDLADQIASDGGTVLAAYQEPLGDHWQLFAMLPLKLVKATPYQRDLSQAHLKRLQEVMKKLDRYLDPITAVRAGSEYWTPNGNHRRAAASRTEMSFIAAIVIPEPDVVYQILAMNTEKAHNLKDKALEVIRMYHALAEQSPRKTEKAFAFEFERPHLLTLGLIYERQPRFAGGAYVPILSRVDSFIDEPLGQAGEERAERAAQVEHADQLVNDLVARGRKRGLTHPYLKNYLVSQCNPLTRARKNKPSYKNAIASLCKNLEAFDLAKVRFGQVSGAALSAAGNAAE